MLDCLTIAAMQGALFAGTAIAAALLFRPTVEDGIAWLRGRRRRALAPEIVASGDGIR